jgi:hypothetical protein
MIKNKTNTNTHETNQPQTPLKAKSIKLGIDVHADSYRVVRQVDHATPQPAQKFSPEGFLVWAKKQLELAEEVHSCYEAGPLGYGLHRALSLSRFLGQCWGKAMNCLVFFVFEVHR